MTRKINDCTYAINRHQDLAKDYSYFTNVCARKVNKKRAKAYRDHYPDDHLLYKLTMDEFRQLLKEAEFV